MTGRRTAEPERGSGTVLVLGVCAVALFLAGAVGLLGGAAVLRHRAEAAADLAALAAATDLGGAGCTRAGEVAGAQGAALTGCRLVGRGVVEVEVRLAAAFPAAVAPPGAPSEVRATARAGPDPGAGESRPRSLVGGS